jgi:gamma-glutamyltranspeptidase/glutathione hydrolase
MDAFYTGAVAADMVHRVRQHANPGRLSEADLKNYRVETRETLCTPWLQWRVCGMPPPSSGHITMMQILGMLEHRSRSEGSALALPLQEGQANAAFLHAYVEASKLAYADRAKYIADADFVSAPAGRWDSLLNPAYLKQRAALIQPRAMPRAEAGAPGAVPTALAPQEEQPEYGTSHISIADANGNVISMTSTVEAVWASRIMSHGGTGLPGGFMLNNELTDFSLAPRDAAGVAIANRVEPGKRPRSSMSPSLVFDAQGRLVLSAGSPGGASIIHYTTKTLLGILAWGLTPQAAIDLPNVANYNGPTQVEKGRIAPATVQALTERGHVVIEAPLESGLQALQRLPTGWVGGADPRREGVVYGK